MSRAVITSAIIGAMVFGGFNAVTWGHDDDKSKGHGRIRVHLVGVNEVPAISSPASGRFEARIKESAGAIEYELRYSGLETAVQQAHIHFGQRHTNGGISVFLCTNLGNGPVGTQACPQSGTVTGTIMAADVIGPTGQGIEAASFEELDRKSVV